MADSCRGFGWRCCRWYLSPWLCCAGAYMASGEIAQFGSWLAEAMLDYAASATHRGTTSAAVVVTMAAYFAENERDWLVRWGCSWSAPFLVSD